MQLAARTSSSAVRATRGAALRAALPVRAVRPAARQVAVKAATSEGEAEVDKIVKDLQEKWDKTENKTGVVLYGAGGIVLIWLSSAIITAINSIPALPKLMELVGLGYSAWFAYRYLLFKSSREELAKDVEDLKKKITGEN